LEGILVLGGAVGPCLSCFCVPLWSWLESRTVGRHQVWCATVFPALDAGADVDLLMKREYKLPLVTGGEQHVHEHD
jgi:hypothetical protein